jgi:hypothetical protein
MTRLFSLFRGPAPCWQERHGRLMVRVHCFTLADNLIVCAAGIIVLAACIAVLAVMP